MSPKDFYSKKLFFLWLLVVFNGFWLMFKRGKSSKVNNRDKSVLRSDTPLHLRAAVCRRTDALSFISLQMRDKPAERLRLTDFTIYHLSRIKVDVLLALCWRRTEAICLNLNA